MATRKGSRSNTYFDFVSPEGRKFSVLADVDPKTGELIYKRGGQTVSKEDTDRWWDDTESYYRAQKQAEIQANRKKGAKKQAKTRKANFVSKRVLRTGSVGYPLGYDEYVPRNRVQGLPRTDNYGRGSRISTNKYAGRGARRGDYKYDYQSITRSGEPGAVVRYKSYAHRGRY